MNTYIDIEYYYHVTNPDDTSRKVKTNFFNDKCDTFIEDYRDIPTSKCKEVQE